MALRHGPSDAGLYENKRVFHFRQTTHKCPKPSLRQRFHQHEKVGDFDFLTQIFINRFPHFAALLSNPTAEAGQNLPE